MTNKEQSNEMDPARKPLGPQGRKGCFKIDPQSTISEENRDGV